MASPNPVRWKRARVAAYVDLCVDVLGVAVAIGGGALLVPWVRNNDNTENRTLLVCVVAISCALFGLLHFFLLFLSIKLIRVTREETDIVRARQVAIWWRNAQIVSIAVTAFLGMVLALILGLIRGPLIFIVHQFANETELVLTTPSYKAASHGCDEKKQIEKI